MMSGATERVRQSRITLRSDGKQLKVAKYDNLLTRGRSNATTTKDRIEFFKICELTANALAADRATKFLPMTAAQTIFIATIAVAFGRTPAAAEGDSPSTYINIEAHSIAFSALYFWLIPAVLLASIIGVSQTENAIPRILHRFQVELDGYFVPTENDSPGWSLFHKANNSSDLEKRRKNGGIYSWQPQYIREALKPHIASSLRDHQSSTYIRFLKLVPGSTMYSFWVVLISQFMGMLISYLVPPVTFGCRDWAELAMAGVVLVSATLDYLPSCLGRNNDDNYEWVYWFTLIKDGVSASANVALVFATQVGIFNKCSCYANEGNFGLALPEMPEVAGTLTYGISVTYPAIAFLCIAFEVLVFPGVVLWQYGDAVSVFTQRDDGKLNRRHWQRFLRGISLSGEWIRRVLRFRNGPQGGPPRRAATSTEEFDRTNEGFKDSAVDNESELDEYRALPDPSRRRPHIRQESDARDAILASEIGRAG